MNFISQFYTVNTNRRGKTQQSPKPRNTKATIARKRIADEDRAGNRAGSIYHLLAYRLKKVMQPVSLQSVQSR